MRFIPSKQKWIIVSIGSGVFVILGIWLIGREPLVGWIGSSFFGLGTVVGILNLFPNASYLELDEDGFTYRSLFRKWSVRWADVEEFVPLRISHNDIVGWNYVADYQPNKKGRKLSSAMSGVESALPDTYGMTSTELVALMDEWRKRHLV